MLNFFRKNSLKIVLGIIIAFIVTTFMGVVFFNQSFQDSADRSQVQDNLKNSIAIIGNDIPIIKQVYLLELTRLQNTLPSDIQMTPRLSDFLQMKALSKAIPTPISIPIPSPRASPLLSYISITSFSAYPISTRQYIPLPICLLN